MKKIFTLMAVAAMAMSMNAQTITWTDAVAKGSVAGTYGTGFVLTSMDTDSKQEIDANKAYFGDASAQTKFTHRLKTGGKSSTKNALSLTIPSAGTLKVYVRTGSNSATDRNLVLTQSSTELYNKVVQESDAASVDIEAEITTDKPSGTTNVYPVISVSVEAGTVEITYPVNGLNFYGFELVTATGIQTIKAVDAQNGAAYNVAGQKVNESYKGIVIKDGKKYMQK